MDIKTKLCFTKIFENDLVAIRKSTLKPKVTLKLHRPAYVRMCIIIVLINEFYYHYIIIAF